MVKLKKAIRKKPKGIVSLDLGKIMKLNEEGKETVMGFQRKLKKLVNTNRLSAHFTGLNVFANIDAKTIFRAIDDEDGNGKHKPLGFDRLDLQNDFKHLVSLAKQVPRN